MIHYNDIAFIAVLLCQETVKSSLFMAIYSHMLAK